MGLLATWLSLRSCGATTGLLIGLLTFCLRMPPLSTSSLTQQEPVSPKCLHPNLLHPQPPLIHIRGSDTTLSLSGSPLCPASSCLTPSIPSSSISHFPSSIFSFQTMNTVGSSHPKQGHRQIIANSSFKSIGHQGQDKWLLTLCRDVVSSQQLSDWLP